MAFEDRRECAARDAPQLGLERGARRQRMPVRRRMAISANTSPALRTPMLVSLPCSSLNTRTEPDLITYRPSAVPPALQMASPNA